MAEKDVDEDISPVPSVDNNVYFHSKPNEVKKLPDWLNHFNSKDLKILFKCSLAVWIYSLFILINPTLRTIGQATFFGVLVMFMAPPSGVIFTSLIAGLTIIVGACLAWAWGSITMVAALATRPKADLEAQYQRLQEMNTQNTTFSQQASGQSTYQQIAIYNGAMLDTRVTVTYFCMMGLFVYLVARIRVRAPRLTLLSIFSFIISDIYLTIGPLIPTFNGTIPRLLILPAAISVGLSLVCNILLFPRSTSHQVLDGMQNVLRPMDAFLEACLLNFQTPEHHMELARLKEVKTKVVQAFQALQANFAFLALDASVGRWSTDDVKSLHEPLRRVLVMFTTLVQLQISRREHKLRDKRLEEVVDFMDPQTDTRAGTQHLSKLYDYRQQSKHPNSEEYTLASLRAMASAGSDIIMSSQEALQTIGRGLRLSNTRRWFGRLTQQQCDEICAKHVAVLENLQRHKSSFAGKTANDLWDRHKHMFDSDGVLLPECGDGHAPPLGGLVLSLCLEERLYNFADALENLLIKLIEVERKRVNVRFWLPCKLQKIFRWALAKDVPAEELALGRTTSMATRPEEDEILKLKQSESIAAKEKKSESKKKSKKGADTAENPQYTAEAQIERMKVRGVQRRTPFGRLLLAISHWFSSTEGMYALRVTIVTICLSIPAVVTSSAGFFYQNKGLWALIMSQTAMLPYTADFVVGFIMRLSGTVIGALIGLVVWYIGAGDGPGNPYGMAVILVPVIIVFMWLRLFTNPAFAQAIILTIVTVYLVMAYSWVDSHIPSYGNPGLGIAVFWRRMLLVLIGFTAAAFVTFFPVPPSASKHYRRLLSDSLQTAKNQYALFAANCDQAPVANLTKVSEKTSIRISDMLLSIEPQIKFLNFEFSTSNFDAKTLGYVCHLCMTLNQNVTQLLIYATNLPEEPRRKFVRFTGANEEALVADVMVVISLLQQCLKTGDPLPAILPVPLIVRSMEGVRARISAGEHVVTMSLDKLNDESARKYSSAMAAFVQFLSTIDEMVLVIKRCVGETTWIDIEGGRASSQTHVGGMML